MMLNTPKMTPAEVVWLLLTTATYSFLLGLFAAGGAP